MTGKTISDPAIRTNRRTRRRFLSDIAAVAICAPSVRPAWAATGSWSADSLAAAAARTGLACGSAVNITPLREDPAYAAAIARECSIVTCENAMKMLYALPQRDRPDFSDADDTVRFAHANRQRIRGHCLVWHEGLPDWALPHLRSASSAEALMRRWIEAIVGRYRGRIEAWDVVNEIIANDESRTDGLRRTPWLDALGPTYVDTAFVILRETDPTAIGTWNENDVEMGSDWNEAKRVRTLRTLETLLNRSVPIKRFGLQSHLDSTKPFDAGRLRRFLAELSGMGLAIEVTEFDIDDRAFPSDLEKRRIGVGDLGRRFLDVVLDEPALLNVLTWDISNADTWLNHNEERRRPDGLKHQALPLDEDFRRNPLWHAMHAAFAAAPDHSKTRTRLRNG